MEKYESLIKIVVNQFENIEYSLREDLKQELRIFLYNNITKIEKTALDLNSYLFISLKRKVINLLKSKKYRRDYSLNNTLASGTEYISMFGTSEKIEDILLKEEIFNFIEVKLTKEEQKLLEQYYYNNLTCKDLGIIYKVSSEAIRKRIKRVIEKIRKEV